MLLEASPSPCAAMEDHMTCLPLGTCWRCRTGGHQATTLYCSRNKGRDSPQLLLHKGTSFSSSMTHSITSHAVFYCCTFVACSVYLLYKYDLPYRYTTYEVLGSLPAPEETAQTLVIKEAHSVGGATRKRRGSISHFFRRKFSLSRKKECKSVYR